MDRDEFRSLPFAEARAKLLEEMGLPNLATKKWKSWDYVDAEILKNISHEPLRSGREG